MSAPVLEQIRLIEFLYFRKLRKGHFIFVRRFRTVRVTESRQNGGDRMNIGFNYRKTLSFLAFFMVLVIPIWAIVFFGGLILDFDITPYLWIGFYGCLLSCFVWKKRGWKVLAIMTNLLPFAFLCFGFLMGGLAGPVYLILKAILPFVPWKFILF